MNCPCGAKHLYADCCGRWHTGEPAPTAETLMRSRYSAFVLELEEYLLATWHPSSRPAAIPFEPGAKWLGLSVIRARTTGPDSAEVEFVAHYRGAIATAPERSEVGAGDGPKRPLPHPRWRDTVSGPRGGSAVRLRERSRFVREAGRWLYLGAAT